MNEIYQKRIKQHVINLLSAYQRIDEIIQDNNEVLNPDLISEELCDFAEYILDLMQVPAEPAFNRDEFYETIFAREENPPETYKLLIELLKNA